MEEVINKIFKQNKINEPWHELITNGLANKIYATKNYILRIPIDHEEAINDARTESVAAPIAHSHGIKSPELILYDNSCNLINKSYSIWERIQGVSLDQIDDKLSLENVWIELGIELGKLHISVEETYDPNEWLDSPDREYSKEQMIEMTKKNYYEKSDGIIKIINLLFNSGVFDYKRRFVHGDTHDGNIMCSGSYNYLALIDWGDAGWADPAIDFYMIPVEILHFVLKGYKDIANSIIDNNFYNRIILDKIWIYMEENKNHEEIIHMFNELENTIGKES
ncbi:MAG: aminoglycoside phosphotransferase family protein [Desulfamplus sp.]|nr:aminoglycoside phosphotransferase family protein [Desulfamplus sp.]